MAAFLRLVIAFALVLGPAESLYFQLAASSTRCLLEDIPPNVPVTITFKPHAPSQDDDSNIDAKQRSAGIIVVVKDPSSHPVVSKVGDVGVWNYFSFETKLDGQYEICFIAGSASFLGTKNKMTNVSLLVETGEASDRYKVKQPKEVDVLQSRIQALIHRTSYVTQEQNQLKTRWETHGAVIENTFSRVFWFALLKLSAVIGICYSQSKYLTRFFKQKKLV
uniref:GOLD domain-containing protein n=1 Tax=Cyanoptyche gloeocystis TaxID=77922 RepID=A0A7S2JMI9_9EUKA|mmetsp:Transcript_18/g.46  ORF Transcript_18/g.46 Transcript_18/m.46 type:complete len:221 (+) Transcript_18:6-668(+)